MTKLQAKVTHLGGPVSSRYQAGLAALSAAFAKHRCAVSLFGHGRRITVEQERSHGVRYLVTAEDAIGGGFDQSAQPEQAGVTVLIRTPLYDIDHCRNVKRRRKQLQRQMTLVESRQSHRYDGEMARADDG